MKKVRTKGRQERLLQGSAKRGRGGGEKKKDEEKESKGKYRATIYLYTSA